MEKLVSSSLKHLLTLSLGKSRKGHKFQVLPRTELHKCKILSLTFWLNVSQPPPPSAIQNPINCIKSNKNPIPPSFKERQ